MDEQSGRRAVSTAVRAVSNNAFVKKVLVLFLAVVVGVSLWWWFLSRPWVTTDNAYVVADTATVSSRIAGRVAIVRVDNDDFVQEGNVLIELDPSDYALKVQQGEAALSALKEEHRLRVANLAYIETVKTTNVEVARAALQIALDREKQAQKKIDELTEKRRSAEADLHHAERDFRRFETLYGQRAVAEREFDRTKTAYKKFSAQLEGVEAELASAKIALDAAQKDTARARAQLRAAEAEDLQVQMERHRIKSVEAQIQKAEAELELMKLQRSYCTIVAPIAGYVAQKRLQVGDWVQPGQPLLAIVPLHAVYVEANFKETQIANFRIGQRAEITADMYPGYRYYGKVAGIRSGTGAAFSLLPPENATGNWIKVVQRVPVKIVLDVPPPPDRPLMVGLSLTVRVHTAGRDGGQKLKDIAR